jgi:hypothetical protein
LDWLGYLHLIFFPRGYSISLCCDFFDFFVPYVYLKTETPENDDIAKGEMVCCDNYSHDSGNFSGCSTEK